jgi:hypothetical protein
MASHGSGQPQRRVKVATTSEDRDAGPDAPEPVPDGGPDAPERQSDAGPEPEQALCTNVIESGVKPLTLWASHKEIAAVEPFPASLTELIDKPRDQLVMNKDRIGQWGWDRGLNFFCLGHLAAQLRDSKIKKGQLSRLAIATHGDKGGLWYPNGQGARDFRDFPPYYDDGKEAKNHFGYDDTIVLQLGRHDNHTYVKTVEEYRRLLTEIGSYVRCHGTILLLGCMMGQGLEGTAILKELARIWRHRKVVGYSTIGIVNAVWMQGPGGKLYLAGVKDSRLESYGEISNKEVEIQKDFPSYQWASDHSEHAKVVINRGQNQDGKEIYELIRCPKTEPYCPTDGVYRSNPVLESPSPNHAGSSDAVTPSDTSPQHSVTDTRQKAQRKTRKNLPKSKKKVERCPRGGC